MTHSLEELKSGNLVDSKRLKLACGLSEFPIEILSLADTLEILDLSDNHISELPATFSQLKKLKIVFFARNQFTEFPTVLANCPVLSMIGFKSNPMETVAENAFPSTLKWLILTDNKIEKLPKSIGDCQFLQKCGLAGNQLEELPAEMAKCKNLELLRISANLIPTIPKWLLELPRLSWLAFSGNLVEHKTDIDSDFDSFDWNDFSIQEQLGEGASGIISKAKWISKNEDIALKVFKGDVTTDGLPEDEMKTSIAAGKHENLIPVLAKIKNHPEEKSGLIMKLISPTYINLGNPPNFDTCTRDVFDDTCSFTGNEILKIATSVASVCSHLHAKGINHGDLYAHNLLINPSADCLLGDFGAATLYATDSDLASLLERVEVRAFGCLVEDLFHLVDENEMSNKFSEQWKTLIIECTVPEVKSRLSFSEILERLSKI